MGGGIATSRPDQQIEVIEVLAQSYDIEDPYAGPVDSWSCSISADGEVLRCILEVSGSELLMRSLQDRVRYDITTCSNQARKDIISFLAVILDGQPIGKEIHSIKDHGNRTLLHIIAWAIRERSVKIDSNSDSILELVSPNAGGVFNGKPNDALDYMRQLFQVLREILSTGAELHERACRYRRGMIALQEFLGDSKETPFTALFSGFSSAQRCYVYDYPYEAEKYIQNDNHIIPPFERVLEPVMAWLKELDNAGIDLETYGRQEMVLRSHRKVRGHELITTRVRSREGPMSRQVSCAKYYVNFTYGPKLCDWKFWFVEMMDSSLQEFWDMVDHPERTIPGAWDETFDNLHNENRCAWCGEDEKEEDWDGVAVR